MTTESNQGSRNDATPGQCVPSGTYLDPNAPASPIRSTNPSNPPQTQSSTPASRRRYPWANGLIVEAME